MTESIHHSTYISAGECQQQLERNRQYQKLLNRILSRIRVSVNLESLCSDTSQDICWLLGIERVAIYKFNEDWSGSFVDNFGFARTPWNDIRTFGKNLVWEDTHLQETKGGRYIKNEPYAVEDIYAGGHSRCHIEALEQFQIRAYAITPIFVGTKIWGLLAAYQHSQPRHWLADEVEFLHQAGSHLGIAMQQAETFARGEQQTRELQNSVVRQRALMEVVGNIRSSLDTQFIFDTTCKELCKLLNLERAAIFQFNQDWSGEFISHFGTVESEWGTTNPFGKNLVWQDTHLQETKGGRYRNNESFAVNDIYEAGHARCHLDILEQFKIRAYALVPIFIGPKLWGLLAAYQHSSPRQWLDYEVEFLSQVGGQLGVAIQQAEFLQQSKQQAIALEKSIARQRTLTDVVTKIRSFSNTDLILETTCQEVCKLLQVERVGVYRFNADWSGEFVSNFGIREVSWANVNPFGKDLYWQDTHLQETKGGRYRHNESFAVNDIYQAGHVRCHLDILEQFKIRAYALTPIFVGQKLWGLLAAYQHTAPRQWQNLEVEFLAQVANQLGVAIQSADLLSQTQSRADEQRQYAQQQQILFDVVAKIRESLDLETIFKTTAQEIRRSIRADRVAVFRFNESDKYQKGKFIAEDVLSEFKPANGTLFEDYCFGENYVPEYTQGKVLTIPNIYKAGYDNCYIESLENLQIKAYILIPLMQGTKLWGLLCVHQCSRYRNWKDEEIKFATQVAAQLSVALRQANLLGKTREQAEQLTQTLKDLQKAQIQMIQSEKMASLGQLVAGIAHEINNPVGFIHGNLQHADQYTKELIKCLKLYQENYPQPASEIQEYLKEAEIEFLFEDIPNLFQSMQVGTDRIREIVLSLRNFSRLDEAEVKEVDVHDGIDSTLMILQNRLKPELNTVQIKIVKDYEVLPKVNCYPGPLNQVFMNLLTNAIDALEEYNKQRTPQDVKTNPSIINISTSAIDKDWITVAIADNGPGIPTEIQDQIFNPFFTTKPVGKGTGLGLSISYQIITEKHGGKLYFHSTPGRGAEFVVEIPVKKK
ncbi:histidine kinase with GAF domain [Rivularia sp. PCC 7116]|uniref:GAF domain-containing protein n=1 Tax=Rivularia sp. PCC 7116 TaxID=373994 RepID=UPI00029EC87E|nr:GAF domain-containing protein [Rivularia sp. PCC 7116]AFY58073.1 histidine kinase with GAF domain [Rivularia sp. PCC 7116]